MPNLVDIGGQRFERLTITDHIYGSEWRALCDCGTSLVVLSHNVRSGRSRSCGCLQKELLSESKRGNKNNFKHGHATGQVTPEYTAWAKAKDRCFNERCKEYFRYGGRGITMCDEWRNDFAAFLEDMGPRSGPGYSIDRIDNDGNYEPGNCRWATQSEQNGNRRPYRKK